MKAGDNEAATDGTAPAQAASNHAASNRASGQSDRKARLAAELRANLARRKAQARSRRAGDADERPEGLGAASAKSGDGPGRGGTAGTGADD